MSRPCTGDQKGVETNKHVHLCLVRVAEGDRKARHMHYTLSRHVHSLE